jgi:hypothetical protein
LWSFEGFGRSRGLLGGNASVRDPSFVIDFIDHLAELQRADEPPLLLHVEIMVAPAMWSIVWNLAKVVCLTIYLAFAVAWKLLAMCLWRPIFTCCMLVGLLCVDRCLQDLPMETEWYPEN